MKRMCLAALTGALAISTMALAIDAASAAARGGVYRGGVGRVVALAWAGSVSVVLASVVSDMAGSAWVVSDSAMAVPESGMAVGAVIGDTAWAPPRLLAQPSVLATTAAAAMAPTTAAAMAPTRAMATTPTRALTMARAMAIPTSCAAWPSADRMRWHTAPSNSARMTSTAGHTSPTAASGCPARRNRRNIRHGIGRHDHHAVLCAAEGLRGRGTYSVLSG